MRTDTHTHSHTQRPACVFSLGSPAWKPRKLSPTARDLGEGEPRGEGAPAGRGGTRSRASVGESFALNHKFPRPKKKR